MILARCFIMWARRRALARGRRCRWSVVTFDGKFSFYRWEPFWEDEWPDKFWDRHKAWLASQPADWTHDSEAWTGTPESRPNRAPWWRPFNAFLHCWKPRHDGEEFHDHPRWTITICLRGELVEKTPWGERTLRLGSIVIRGRKAIHAFSVAPAWRGKTWTLFIVGRRKHRQNRYLVQAQ